MNIKELYQNLEIYTTSNKFTIVSTTNNDEKTFYISDIKIVKSIYADYKTSLKSTHQYSIDEVVDIFIDTDFEMHELYAGDKWKTDIATMLIKVNNELKSIIRKIKIEKLIK